MACYHPLNAYRSLVLKTDNGKSVISFNLKDIGMHPWEDIQLPCSQCIGCRIDRSRQWALRCVHEASLYSNNCFITLTFNDENLDGSGSLVKSDFQKFMKRLRKRFCVKKSFRSMETVDFIRYFHCGEYGSQLSRPHHHACLFNFDFHDKKLWSVRSGVRLYRSADLEKLWPFGFCTVGDVTFESAAYVARYITKKINGQLADYHYRRVDRDSGEILFLEPEYITMSRRPGIARRWFEKFVGDVYPKDFITHFGKKFKPPRYYDNIYDVMCPNELIEIKLKRKLDMNRRRKDNTVKRLSVREKVQISRVNKLKREYEK